MEESIEIDCDIKVIAAALEMKIAEDTPSTLTMSAPVPLRRSGIAMRLVQRSGYQPLPLPSR